MSRYRTALGRTLDMAALVAKNEKTRAVGNMSVNARGDTIDSHGRIITPVTQKTSDGYQKTVKNKSAQMKEQVSNNLSQEVVRPQQMAVAAPPVIDEELTPEERELNANLQEDLEIEKLKQQELAKK